MVALQFLKCMGNSFSFIKIFKYLSSQSNLCLEWRWTFTRDLCPWWVAGREPGFRKCQLGQGESPFQAWTDRWRSARLDWNGSELLVRLEKNLLTTFVKFSFHIVKKITVHKKIWTILWSIILFCNFTIA